ncbi:MAG: DUF748 domain-containing protein [Nitrospirales bacterium]
MESSAYHGPFDGSPQTQAVRPPPAGRRPWMRRLRTLSLILAALVALYALLGFLALPAYLRAKIPAVLTQQLRHPVTVGDVTFNPFTLALTVKEFDIREQDTGPLIGFAELYVNIGLSSLTNRALTFDQIRLRIPYGLVKIRHDGTLNLLDLRPVPDASASPPVNTSASRSLPSLIIRSLEIEQGAVEFHDESRPTPFSAHIVPIWLAVKNFRTLHAGDNAFAFKAEFEAGESLEWEGTVLLNPVRSDGHVVLSGLKTREVWEYIQDRAGFEITDGVLHVEARYHAEAGADGVHANVSDGEISLDNLTLSEKGAPIPLIVLPTFAVKGIQADLLQHQIQIGMVQSNGARIQTWIDKEGTINFRHLFAPAQAAAPANTPSPPATADRQQAPWTVSLKELNLEDYGVSMEDRRPPSPVRLDLAGLRVHINNVTYPPTARLDLAASVEVNSTGRISTSGTVGLSPVTADLALEVTQLPLMPFQPYVSQAAKVEIRNGSASLKGRLQYQPAEKPSIRFHGDASVTKLATVDAQLNKDLVNWDSLSVKRIDLALPAEHATIGEVIATKPYADIMISADRTLNLRTILTKPQQSKTGTLTESTPGKVKSPPSRPLLVTIGSVTISGGSAHFADFSVQPIVDTGIYGLKGTIKGLSSKEQARADVSLQGEVDKYAPVTIAGQINPLSHHAFTDLNVAFKNVELTTLSPYSTKFAGYPIVKGKLSMDLHYKLDHEQLEANNNVLIDQLTLGDKTDSPDATSLPVKLAIALLKDRHGRITIDLPVKGDLSHPEFEYGTLIWNVLTTLLTKVVASPFTLMAKLVGGSSDELSEVPFLVGSAEIVTEKLARLKALAKSLEERPALQLEVSGMADPAADGAALSEIKLQTELEVLKQEAPKNSRKSPSYTDAGDTDGLLRTLYVQKFGRLPDQTDPKVPVPPEQLKERLLYAFPIEDAELRLLAQERGKQIQHFLINEAGIPAERVFLLDAKLNGRAQNGTVTSHLSLTAG